MQQSKLWRRLRLFFIGFAISALVCYFTLWRGRGEALGGWLPNDRVIAFLLKSTMSVQDKPRCLLDCHGMTLPEVQNALKDADVDFGNSVTNTEPCKQYQLKITDKQGQPMELRFNACIQDSTSQLIAVYPEGKPVKACECK